MRTLIGAICGDTIGSVYEFNPTKDYNFPLTEKMTYTDDSICTVAVASWLLNSETRSEEDLVGELLKFCQQEMSPMGGYGGGFMNWLVGEKHAPYGSWGNGSAMRASAVGFAAKSLEEAMELGKRSAEVTHNHKEGIKGAQAVAVAIYMARMGASKEEIKRHLEKTFRYNLSRKYEKIKAHYEFDPSCQGTVPEAVIAFLESTDYEDAVRKTVALGGDADTMGAITGGIAVAFYGAVPESWEAFTVGKLPDFLLEVVERFESVYGGNAL